jgi:hypothetical protein
MPCGEALPRIKGLPIEGWGLRKQQLLLQPCNFLFGLPQLQASLLSV